MADTQKKLISNGRSVDPGVSDDAIPGEWE
jgi:hypothetical protein